MVKSYRMYVYDLFGNVQNGFDVVNVRRNGTEVKIDPDGEDEVLLSSLIDDGILMGQKSSYTFDGDSEDVIFVDFELIPCCEFRAIE